MSRRTALTLLASFISFAVERGMDVSGIENIAAAIALWCVGGALLLAFVVLLTLPLLKRARVSLISSQNALAPLASNVCEAEERQVAFTEMEVLRTECLAETQDTYVVRVKLRFRVKKPPTEIDAVVLHVGVGQYHPLEEEEPPATYVIKKSSVSHTFKFRVKYEDLEEAEFYDEGRVGYRMHITAFHGADTLRQELTVPPTGFTREELGRIP